MGPRERLIRYLRSCRGSIFTWGTHDCFTFTNGAFHAMYGAGYADDWVGRYMNGKRPAGRDALRREFGYDDFKVALDDRLRRITYTPPLGALLVTSNARKWHIGGAMGISNGTKGVFLSREGMLHLPLDEIDLPWIRP